MNILGDMLVLPLLDPHWIPFYELAHTERKHGVLVVEDDPMFRMVLSAAVTSVDPEATIEWVSSMEAAKKRLKRESYSLVIADYFLEGKGTGLDLWRDCKTGKMPNGFVLTSSLSNTEVRELVGDNTESLSYIKKPLNVATLRKVLGQHLKIN